MKALICWLFHRRWRRYAEVYTQQYVQSDGSLKFMQFLSPRWVRRMYCDRCGYFRQTEIEEAESEGR